MAELRGVFIISKKIQGMFSNSNEVFLSYSALNSETTLVTKFLCSLVEC